MSFRLEFVSEIPFELNLEVVSTIVLTMSEIAPEAQEGIVNVAFVDDETMRGYNRDYRGIDTTTDVLSFHYFEDFSACGADEVVGEILLSESRIRQQAPEYGNETDIETYKLLVHSLAHLLGYDHEDDQDHAKMKAVEDGVTAELEKKFGFRLG
ncbi:MAG: putative rRNA maturation factor [Patescibacteria group bacterium]|nr:putative rRNA maturation factor [Patescibacteria group bacterium]